VNFFQILKIVAPVFILVGGGYLFRRLRWMAPEADQTILKLGVNVLLPALIADTVLGNPLLSKADDLWQPPLLAFVLITTSMGVVALLLAPLKLPHETTGAGIITAGVQNFGYMVIPLVEALYDRQTLGVLFIHNLGVEIAMWSVGVWILARKKAGSSWRNLVSTPAVAVLLSGLLNLLNANAWMPEVLRKSLHMLGQAAIPLALLLTGVTIYDQVRQRNEEPPRYAALSIALLARLAVLPLLILAVARFVPMPTELRNVLVLQAAMPSAMMPVVICRHHGADSRFCVQIVLLSTAFSLVTVPLWIAFGTYWIGRL
jgi:predicted permease